MKQPAEPHDSGTFDLGRDGAASNGGANGESNANGRGRPRDEEFDARILAAGFDELSRSGISHFSVAAVARRAGVSKGSIYLRWPTREQLIFDCALQVRAGITSPGRNNLRGDLEQLADQWAEAFSRPRAIEVLLRVDADREEFPELFQRIYEHLQEAGNRVIAEAILEARERGEIAESVSLTLVNRMFVGAMFVQALRRTPHGASTITPEFRRELVDFLVAALAPVPGPVRG